MIIWSLSLIIVVGKKCLEIEMLGKISAIPSDPDVHRMGMIMQYLLQIGGMLGV